MDSNNLTTAQARLLNEALFPHMYNLDRVKRRMSARWKRSTFDSADGLN
jgi:hypothetical protein